MCIRACLVFSLLFIAGSVQAGEEPTKPALRPWTLPQALELLTLNPRDPYLQYITLQLARNEGKIQEVLNNPGLRELNPGFNRREQLDVFNLFSGALAVQESLQRETLLESELNEMKQAAGADEVPIENSNPRHNGKNDKKNKNIQVDDMAGPEQKSHPWKKLLNGREPQVSALSKLVPLDFYFVEFRSLDRMIETMECGDLWGSHFLTQAQQEARKISLAPRLKAQLAVETNPLLRPIYDMVVDSVAATGSDLYVNEGSDLTLLFKLKQPALFRARMDGFLLTAAQSPGATKEEGVLFDVPFTHISTPDRAIQVYSAYPEADLHLRSNSLPALQRVLAAIKGQPLTAGGPVPRRLGESDEFKYIRTLLLLGAPEEDGLVYLSDPFIRRIVGPRVKLTERRRMLCHNHLRMIGYGSLLYLTQQGQKPANIKALADAQCAPSLFGEGQLKCPEGGTYALTPDGLHASCSCHGHAGMLTPCLELPIEKLTLPEVEQYNQFLEQYNQYWRTYFDPIVLRIQAAPERLRIETLVLPLLDNSIYTSLSSQLGGKLEVLDTLPHLPRTIFSLGLNVNRKDYKDEFGRTFYHWFWWNHARMDENASELRKCFEQGLEDYFSVNIYDAPQLLDINMQQALMGMGGMGRGNMGEISLAALWLGSVTAPTYLGFPVKDEKSVERMLEILDEVFPPIMRQESTGWFTTKYDFSRISRPNGEAWRMLSVGLGPITWRFYYARIGKGFYIATQPCILEDLEAQQKNPQPIKPLCSEPAQAFVKIQPEHWKQVLSSFQIGWEVNRRRACLSNLGALTGVSRGMPETRGAEAQAVLSNRTDLLYGVHFFCPDGGRYESSADGTCRCSVHGTSNKPQQGLTPVGDAMKNFGGAQAALSLSPEGVHAVLTIERNP